MQRRGQSLTWLFGVAAAVACVGGVVVSCLPDLQGVPNLTDAGAVVCGNGIIEPGEQCDPGIKDGSIPGCSRTCSIDCDGGYVDLTSNHCYFILSGEAGPYEAGIGCAEQGAHVVTMGSLDEVNTVPDGLDAVPRLKIPPAVWLGLNRNAADGGPDGAFRAVVDEPGFDVPAECAGCFVPGGAVSPSPSHPRAAGATWSVREAKSFSASCEGPFPTLCEREPAGSRRYDCGGLWCFNVEYDVRSGTPKTYLWDPTRMSAAAAVSTCSSLGGDSGTASLVIFDNNEQREQVFYELMHLPDAGGPPTDFWIGVTSTQMKLRDGGHKLDWVSDNGQFFHTDWGNHEPTATQAGVRAYASQTGTSYESPGATYDTQLAHAHDPDGGVELHAVLCEMQE